MWIVAISKSKSGGNKMMYLLSSFCNTLGLHDVGICGDGTTTNRKNVASYSIYKSNLFIFHKPQNQK